MLGIYARTFMTATGLDRVPDRPIAQPKIRAVRGETRRRWSPAGHWIDPPEEF